MTDLLSLEQGCPELLVFLIGCSVLILGVIKKIPDSWLLYASVGGLLLATFFVWATWPNSAQSGDAFYGLYDVSGLTSILQIGILLAAAASLAYSGDYLKNRNILNGEYLSLALFATCGMMLMVAASHFLILYLGLELMSLSLYAMIALRRECTRAIEAAMKYFVLGALASGILLYGMSMIYAATGTFDISTIAFNSASDGVSIGVLIIGVVFLVAGAAFKLGAAPFHMWLPDVYDGAPTAVTMFVGGAPKIAAFAMMIRIVAEALAPLSAHWTLILVALAIASLGIGNVIAIAQTSLKRMFAYSTISHMGFLLTGIVAGSEEGYAAALFYAFSYTIMSVGAFGMLVLLSRGTKEVELLSDMKGLASRNPIVAVLMLIMMLSMAGIPPLVGFYAKLAVWSAAIEAGWTWLVIIAAVFSVVGAFYYLRVIKLMYFDQPDDKEKIIIATPYMLLASFNSLLIFGLGILPGSLLAICVKVFQDF